MFCIQSTKHRDTKDLHPILSATIHLIHKGQWKQFCLPDSSKPLCWKSVVLLNSGHTHPKALGMQCSSFHASRAINSIHMIPKTDLLLLKVLRRTYRLVHSAVEKFRLVGTSGDHPDHSAQSRANFQVASNFSPWSGCSGLFQSSSGYLQGWRFPGASGVLAAKS